MTLNNDNIKTQNQHEMASHCVALRTHESAVAKGKETRDDSGGGTVVDKGTKGDTADDDDGGGECKKAQRTETTPHSSRFRRGRIKFRPAVKREGVDADGGETVMTKL
jgi:hypothetical protein